MKFKNIITWLLAVSCLLLLAACNETPLIETTTGETTSAETTTLETTTAETTTTVETTTEAVPEFQKGGRMLSDWSPRMSWMFYPWTISPDYEYEPSRDYEIEITGISDEIYESLPRTVTLQITSKTGKPITQYGSPYLEIYEAAMFEGVGAWVRMPYIVEEEAEAGLTPRESSYEYKLGISENMLPIFEFPEEYALYYQMHIRDMARSETLKCRIVLYLNDGPHYVEFCLNPSSDPRHFLFSSEYKWPYGSWINSDD